MGIREDLRQAIIEGHMRDTPELTRAALGGGEDAVDLMNEVLIPAMQVVGEKFESKEYFVPEVLVSARAMQASLELLRPLLAAVQDRSTMRAAVGTVKGDVHEIGKNIVCMVLEGAGFEVVDLGVDVDPSAFVEAASNGARVIGMSSLLTTSRGQMRDTIEALAGEGLRDSVKVLVGGAAVTPEFARAIGADAFGKDANEAVRLVKRFEQEG